MNEQSLGRLEHVDLRTIWTSEPTEFTPWLARSENLALLGETLGLDLELEAQEKAVGPFRADIICKDINTDTWVLIENQLGRTDHTHMGQLLTYAAGLQAVTIVWLAARFTDEHRAVLDWLNKITHEDFRFFGLEIELWKICDSPAAPKFNIISKPNDWSKSVAQAARMMDDTELSATKLKQREYWTALQNKLNAVGGPISGNRKPQPQSWMAYPIGRGGFHLGAATNRLKNVIRVELYISGKDAKKHFSRLEQQKETIEQELDYVLKWNELPGAQDSGISIHLENANPEDESDWPRQHEWIAEHLNKMHRVFSQRVRGL